MMFEPGLTKGVLETFVSPAHHSHFSSDDQSTKAIDIQNAYLHGKKSPGVGCLNAAALLLPFLLVFKNKNGGRYWLGAVVTVFDNPTLVVI